MKNLLIKKVIPLLMAFVLLLSPLSGLSGVLAAETSGRSDELVYSTNAAIPSTMSAKNWMAFLPNNTDLSHINLPGSEYAGAIEMMTLNYKRILEGILEWSGLDDLPFEELWLPLVEKGLEAAFPELAKINIPMNSFGKHQDMTITTQLEAGVRVLDCPVSQYSKGGPLVLSFGGIKCLDKEKLNNDPRFTVNEDGTVIVKDEAYQNFVSAADTSNGKDINTVVANDISKAINDSEHALQITTILNEAKKFVKDHPTETVVIDVTGEDFWFPDVGDVDNVFAKCLLTIIHGLFDEIYFTDTENIGKWADDSINSWLYKLAYTEKDPDIIALADDQTPFPTVGEARGKVVLVKKENLTTAAHNAEANTGSRELNASEKVAKLKTYVQGAKAQSYTKRYPELIFHDKLCPEGATAACQGSKAEYTLNAVMIFFRDFILDQAAEAVRQEIEESGFIPGLSEGINTAFKKIMKAIVDKFFEKFREDLPVSAAQIQSNDVNPKIKNGNVALTKGKYYGWFNTDFTDADLAKKLYSPNIFDFDVNGGPVNYISKIAIAYDPDLKTAKDNLKTAGYSVLNYGMNELGNDHRWSSPMINGKAASSTFQVAIGYKTSQNPADAITDILWTHRKNEDAAVDYDAQKLIQKFNYTLVEKDATDFTHPDIKSKEGYGDFNISTKGYLVNLYYSTDPTLGERFNSLENLLSYYKTKNDPITGKPYPQSEMDEANRKIKQKQNLACPTPKDSKGVVMQCNYQRPNNDVYLFGDSVFHNVIFSVSRAPKITAGTQSQWNQRQSDQSLVFRSNASIEDFLRVEVDGQTIDSSNYFLREGSIIVELKPNYLATLSPGKHTISIISYNGMGGEFAASTDFLIAETDVAPATGTTTDAAPMAAALILICAAVVAGGGYAFRKR